MTTIGQFTVVSKIHEGSDTIVYRGYRTTDQSPVALKVPRSEFPSQRELAKLRHEYAILSLLKIPGVVQVYELTKHNISLALVMEELREQPLNEILHTQKIDIASGLKIAIHAAGILGAIHDNNIIHKDLKPHNILIEPSTNKVLIIDFGIATLLSHETQQPMSPDVLEGSLAYMSPEQTGRMNRSIDYRTDFYSFGVTLYELFTGELPFTTLDPIELVHSHIARQPTPPHQRNRDVSPVLSGLILKLLAKNAEDRYQSAYGLKADLEECLRQWEGTGTIAPFVLGQKDRSGRLRISQKLYGRDEELKVLLTAFERVHAGSAEVLLVAGPSGIGKTALVSEVQKSISYHGGHFFSGKFEQLSRNVPYRAIAHAFRELIQQILSERADVLGRWREKLQAALDINGRLLCEIIPELELIIGAQPPVSPVGPTEAENRFNLVFQNFVRAFCTPEHTLALFLDDLQFADPASLKLLQVLAGDPERRHFLIIGAYRDDELTADHPLLLALRELRASATLVSELKLKPLQLADVTALIADSLDSTQQHCEPLSRIVFDKTLGSPFFVGQFLGLLYSDKLLTFDPPSGEWRWDRQQINQRMVTANVVPFMLDKVQRLPADTLRLLQLAACIGYQFDLQILALTNQNTPEKTATDLWEALRAGLVVPLSTDYRFVHSIEPADAESVAQLNVKVVYRFAHDRVRQAAYSLLDEARRTEVHLRIGRLLLLRHADDPRDEALFDTVNHLNNGAPLITDPSERLHLARLNLAAGIKAKAASAHAAAVEHLAAGQHLLEENSWESAYELSFALHVERLEGEYLCGRYEQAEALFSTVLSHVRTDLERVQVYNLRIVLYTTQGKFTDAIAIGRTALALLGIELPATAEQIHAAFGAELGAIAGNLAGRRVADLLDAKVMQDPAQQVVIKLMVNLFAAAFAGNPALSLFLAAKQVNLSLVHGNSELSAYGYATYGMILASLFGRYAEAYEFGRLALALNEKFNNLSLQCKLANIYGGFVHVFRRPIREAIPYFESGNQAGQEFGDFTYLAHNSFQIVLCKLAVGDELTAVEQEVTRFLSVMLRTREALPSAFLRLAQQFVYALLGQTKDPKSLGDEEFDEGRFLAEMGQHGFVHATYLFYMFKLQLYFLAEDYESGYTVALEAEKISQFAGGSYISTEVSFFTCLTAAMRTSAGSGEEQQRCQELLTSHAKKLATWAENAPENFRHKQLLVAAEQARLAGKIAEAMELYDQAISTARSSEFVNHEALANELAARFYFELGRKSIAALYMGHAYRSYVRWGATTKATQLAKRWEQLIPPTPLTAQDTKRESVGSATTTSTRLVASGTLDVATVFRAAQAIAGEIMLEKVIAQLMHIVLSNAGAQRALLILKRDQNFFVEASITVDPSEVQVNLHIPLARRADLAKSIVQYVAHAREPVVIADAARDKRFSSDPHISLNQPKSILCVPLLHQGRLTGVIYLENNLSPHAFTADRVDILQLLSAQAAIAVENAMLYEHVQSVTKKLRTSNDELTQTNERLQTVTIQLRDTNQDLLSTNARLEVELKERARAQLQHAQLQEDVIAAQRARLAEMSTPLIPITEKIMVMPLIGTMDAQRAEQVLETALQGAQSNSAQVVIIDITGMKHVDTSVASTLISTAAALRLLGAEVVLTGIRAEVAQTLVGLGIDLGNIVTRSNLQSGISYALSRAGAALIRRK